MKLHPLLHPILRHLMMLGVLPGTFQLSAQVPHPKDVLSFTPGDDHQLATHQQLLDYFQQLDAASARVVMRKFSTT